jgi:uncharacterized protein
MEYLIRPFEVKADASDTGIITGYGSIFGNVDSYGDRVAKGAFAKSIHDVMTGVTAWPAMLLQHGGSSAEDRSPVGIWTRMEENEHGLRLEGKLALKNTRGAEAYALLTIRPRPALDGLSIGYRAKEFELHKSGSGPNGAKRTLKSVDLVEISLVTFPADRFAKISSVKSWLEVEPEPAPAFTMLDLARADYEMLCPRNDKGKPKL